VNVINVQKLISRKKF